MVKCNQSTCDKPGLFRFTWPGEDEAVICIEHAPTLQAVAAGMGIHLQLRPVEQLEISWDGLDGPCTE